MKPEIITKVSVLYVHALFAVMTEVLQAHAGTLLLFLPHHYCWVVTVKLVRTGRPQNKMREYQ